MHFRVWHLALAVVANSSLICPAVLAQGGFKVLWEHPTPREYPLSMVVDGAKRPFLYVALKNGGLQILDISSQDKPPREIARLGTEVFGKLDVMYVTRRGEHLYLALGDFFRAGGAPAGLAVVNVRIPSKPKVLSVWRSQKAHSGAAAVVVDDRYAYVGVMKEGVMIFDVARTDRIVHVSTFLPDIQFPRKNPGKVQHPNARGLFLRGNLLYVAYDAGGLRILDVTDKKKPREIGRYVNQGMANKQQAYNDVLVENKLAYLTVDYAGFEIVDIQNPRNIRQVSWWNPWEAHTLKNLWFNSPGHTNQIALAPDKKLAYLSAGDSELQVIDVSLPARPRLANWHGQPKNKFGVWSVTISADRVFLGYITSVIPFQGTWAGIKALKR